MTEIVALSSHRPLRAVITGAADETGTACARALRDAGAELALADIDKVPLARLANELGAHAFACDVLSELAVSEMVAQVAAALPSVDLLINAAGTGYVRTLGMMRVSRAFAAAAGGRPMTIVNLAAPRGRPEPFGYAGSKQAFRRLSDGLGAVLSTSGIRVVAIEDVDSSADVAALMLQYTRHSTAPKPLTKARRARG